MHDKWVEKNGADGMLELSGIPAMRLYCRSPNRSDRQAEISNFVQARLPGLLKTIGRLSNTTVSRMGDETALELWKDALAKVEVTLSVEHHRPLI